jgi:hypothetical protein
MKPRRSFCVLAMAALALAGCSSSDDPTAGGKGQVRFVMSSGSAPAGAGSLSALQDAGDWPQLQSADVTFTSIVARSVDGNLVDVEIDLPATVDLLQVVQGHEVTLPVGALPPGTYDELVVVMSSVRLAFDDGGEIAITPPGGGWTAVAHLQDPFVVVEGQTTTLDLKFRWWDAFEHEDGDWAFHPGFDCEEDED